MDSTADPAASPSNQIGQAQSRPYRSKKRQPCDACRSRRTGCIIEGSAVKCALCQHRGIECTFVSQPIRKKRRLVDAAHEHDHGPGDDQSGGISRNPAYPPRGSQAAWLHEHNHAYGEDQSGEISGSPASPPRGSRVAYTLTLPGLSSTPLVRLLNTVDTTQVLSPCLPDFGAATMLRGYTCLYSGASGDQDPHLLRHLSFDNRDCFGHSGWTVWKVLPKVSNPVYFTIFPNDHLDQHADMYNTESIDQIVGARKAKLLDLYYSHIHHSYPILESRRELEKRIQHGSIRLSLLTCIYCIAMAFGDESEELRHECFPKRYEMSMLAFSILNIEARAPNLDVVKALLIYMQFLPAVVREPNRPGDWALTSLLLGVAQDIGLHKDPSDWNIPTQERKARRVLWWSVYIHEKWTAHWLGRPSHIRVADWDVGPLSLTDFSDESNMLDVNLTAAAEAFMGLASLTGILSDILDTFYTVRGNFSGMKVNEAYVKGKVLQDRWREWEIGTRMRDGSISSTYTYNLQIASHMVNVSILRAIFGSHGGHSDEIAAEVSASVEDLVQLLEQISNRRPKDLWLSYCQGNLQIVGSVMITLLLASLDDAILMVRRNLLFRYRNALVALANSDSRASGIAKSPLIRLDLICQPLFGGTI